MHHASRDHGRPADLNHVIEQRIRQRTSGRIHNLAVEITPGSVVVSGRVGTYYLKQLAVQAALSVAHGLKVCVKNLEVIT